MSGFSPASCWLAHKTVGRWTRAAKERTWGNKNGSNSSDNSLEVNVVFLGKGSLLLRKNLISGVWVEEILLIAGNCAQMGQIVLGKTQRPHTSSLRLLSFGSNWLA